ncbi:uncharacterized protein TNCV_385781 [Trichonephila clavipes]|nr:uncharacterized protein TNCV_385781 [Trichonephila clavipes]
MFSMDKINAQLSACRAEACSAGKNRFLGRKDYCLVQWLNGDNALQPPSKSDIELKPDLTTKEMKGNSFFSLETMTEVNQDEPQFALSVNAESFVPKVDKTQIMATACFKNKCLLSTALILVKDKYSEWQTFRALLDSGSNSKDIAFKRLGSLWNRLARDENYLNLYREFLGDYERLGHMKEVTNETEPKITHYATHHGIYRPEKSKTKLRVVFNCSSLTDNGISLNDIQYNGEVIQEVFNAQMLRFRTYTYAFTADIKMMYRTILINTKQRNLQRIVWCESEHESPKI